MQWLKKHSIEIILLVACCTYFGAMAAPDMSWVNTDCDGPTYLSSAKYLTISHPSGAPLYNLINAVAVRIPIGAEYWRLCMVSAMAAGATCLLLYLIAKRYSKGKWKAMIAPLVYCASGVVVSQATILDTYSVVTFLGVLAYYCHVTGHIRSKYLVLGCGLAVHHLILIPLGVLWVADLAKNIQARKRGEQVGFIRPAMFLWMLGLLFFMYIPLQNHPPYHWIGGTGINDYISYFFGQGGLVGGLAVLEPDALLRLYDFISISALCFALSGLLIVPGMYLSYKRKDYEGILCSFLLVFFLLYYLTDEAPQTYVYMMPAFAFGGLLAVKGLGFITMKRVGALVAVSSIALMIFNIQTYDIGRNLDKGLECKTYYDSLANIPDNSVLWLDQGGNYKVSVWLYALDTGKNLSNLPDFSMTPEWNIDNAQEIFESGHLIIQEPTNPVVLRPAVIGDLAHIREYKGIKLVYAEGAVKASWTNPVDLITGKVDKTKWKVATESSVNAGFLITFGLWGVGCTYVGDFFVKRNRAMDKRKRVLIRAVILAAGICLFIGICALAGMELAI
jgi:hypothetical protein